MKETYIIACLILICLVVVGCNAEYSESELDEMAEEIELNYSMPNMQGGVSLGLFNTDGEIESSKTFTIEKGESFKKMISIGNMINNDRDYKVLLFVDYKQHDFIVNGTAMSEYNYKAEINETSLIPVEIRDLNEGLHDVFFVIVKYPTNKSLDEEFRMSTDMGNLLFIRFSLIVGEKAHPTFSVDDTFSSTETVFDGVFVSKSDSELMVWLSEDIKQNTELNFNIYVGNESFAEKQTCAVITLLDWKQVDFYDGQNVVFFEVKKGDKIAIPSTVHIQNSIGINDLATILVYNPYEELDIYNNDIQTGIRVGINIE